MARLDLFALARANEAALTKQSEDRRAALVGDHLTRFDRFSETVGKTGGISMNMKPWKLLAFLRRGRYLSVHEVAEERAAASGTTSDDELRRSQGTYYERRVLFDRAFEQGELFLYGALNIGGPGAIEYGLFCLFFGQAVTGHFQGAFLPDNSLERYVKPAAVLTLDDITLRQEVATSAQKHCLAALKHVDDLASLDPQAWGGMLCSKQCFVEAIVVGELRPDHVEQLRVARDEMRRFADLALDDMMGKVAPVDRVELEDFTSCLAVLQASGLAALLMEV